MTPLASSSLASEVPKRAIAAQRPTQRSRMPPGPFLRSGSSRKIVSPKRLWRAFCSARNRATKSSAAVVATRARNASRNLRGQLGVAGQKARVEQRGRRRQIALRQRQRLACTSGPRARRRPWRPTADRESPRPAPAPRPPGSWRTAPADRGRNTAPARSGRSRRSRGWPPASGTWRLPARPPRSTMPSTSRESARETSDAVAPRAHGGGGALSGGGEPRRDIRRHRLEGHYQNPTAAH